MSRNVSTIHKLEEESYPAVHVGGAVQVHAGVVGPLQWVQVGAVVRLVGAINEKPVLGDVAHAVGPVPGLLRPLGVGRVPGVHGETSAEVEEAAVCDCVLVLEAAVHAEDLPVQAAVAVLLVPARHLRVHDALRERQPAGLVVGRVVEVALGGDHGREAPEGLVVVAQTEALVVRHEVLGGGRLVDEGLLGDVVVLVVAGVVPVVDEGAKHGAGLPPVVRVGQVAGHITRFPAGVVFGEVFGSDGGGIFEGFLVVDVEFDGVDGEEREEEDWRGVEELHGREVLGNEWWPRSGAAHVDGEKLRSERSEREK